MCCDSAEIIEVSHQLMQNTRSFYIAIDNIRLYCATEAHFWALSVLYSQWTLQYVPHIRARSSHIVYN